MPCVPPLRCLPLALLLMAGLSLGCGGLPAQTPTDAGGNRAPDDGVVHEDAGVEDAGVEDAGAEDVGVEDAGVEDAGAEDVGVEDAGVEDAGVEDAGVEDAGVEDAGVEDAGVEDAGTELACEGTDAPCERVMGVCEGAVRACVDGAYEAVCSAASYGPDFQATELRCDGLDNDCDGRVDRSAVVVIEGSPPVWSMAPMRGGAVAVTTSSGALVTLQRLGEDLQPLEERMPVPGTSASNSCTTRMPEVLPTREASLVTFVTGACADYRPFLRGVRLDPDGNMLALADGGFAETLLELGGNGRLSLSTAPDGMRAAVLFNQPDGGAPGVQFLDARGALAGDFVPLSLPTVPDAGTDAYPSYRLTLLDGEHFAVSAQIDNGPLVVQRYSASGAPLGDPQILQLAQPVQVSAGDPSATGEADLALASWEAAPDGGYVVQLNRGLFFDAGVESWPAAGVSPSSWMGGLLALPAPGGPVVVWSGSGGLWTGTPGGSIRQVAPSAELGSFKGWPELAWTSAGDVVTYAVNSQQDVPATALRFCAP